MNFSEFIPRFAGVTLLLMLLLAAPSDTMAQGKGKGNKNNAVKAQPGPPPWAPAHGYRAKTRYVYFSDYNVYYDHERGVYISLGGNNWQITAKLPSILSGVDLTAAVKVDLDFSGDDPQRNNREHKQKFGKR